MCEWHFAKLFSCFLLVRFDAEISTDMLESSCALLKSDIDRSEFIFLPINPLFCVLILAAVGASMTGLANAVGTAFAVLSSSHVTQR
jgi:hypothetical protein